MSAAASARATGSRRPKGLLAYVGATVAVATTIVTALALAGPRTIAGGVLENVGFLALLTAAEYLIVRFHFRGETMGITLFEAVLAPLIFAFPSIQVVLLVGAAVALSGLLHRDRPLKAIFNVAQWVIASASAAATFQWIRSGNDLSLHDAGALALALAVGAAVNMLLFTNVMRLAQSTTTAKVLREVAPAIGLGWALNTPIGLLYVAAFSATPFALVMFAVPLVMLRWAHRSYAMVSADRARLDGLHRATRVLVAPMDPRDALGPFLTEVRASFAAEAVDLVLPHAGGRAVHRVTEHGYLAGEENDDIDSLAALLCQSAVPLRVTAASTRYGGPLLREGWDNALAAPVIADGTVLGVLVAYGAGGPEGFESGELSVLSALASEVGGAIHKGVLVGQIIEERRKLADIVEQTSDGIVTFGPEGTVLSWNPGFEHITGYRAADMLGAHGIDRIRPRDTDGTDVFVERWASGSAPLPSTVQIRTRDGATRWLSWSATRVNNGDDEPRVLVIVARDVTKAHEVDQLKEDFVATVSHELRTPLTPIKGWSETLLRSGELMTAEEREQAARSILRQAEHLESLITNLLEVSRLEGGTDAPRSDFLDVRTLAEKVWRDFRHVEPSRALILDVRDDANALGDVVFFEEVLSNLITNAIKYSPVDQQIMISVGSTADGVEVQVRDHGPGIPASEQERIFERFARLGDVTTRTIGGSGLGLYIARQLATAMGGSLEVSSVVGEGSTFTLRLRAAGRLAAVKQLAV